jgi:hypothetical protein
MAKSDMGERMVAVVDWVHRTGWPARVRDTDMAMRLFDAWRQATQPMASHGDEPDRRAILEALTLVFSDYYDSESVEHLCALFAAVFELHLRATRHPPGEEDGV